MVFNYKEALVRVFEQLGESKLMVLATSYKDYPTARMMSCIMYDGKIAFQTSRAFVKYKQMQANPQVALCVDNLQIEGRAHFAGHPYRIFIDVKRETAYKEMYDHSK